VEEKIMSMKEEKSFIVEDMVGCRQVVVIELSVGTYDLDEGVADGSGDALNTHNFVALYLPCLTSCSLVIAVPAYGIW